MARHPQEQVAINRADGAREGVRHRLPDLLPEYLLGSSGDFELMMQERVSYRNVLVIATIYTFSLFYLAGFPHVRLAYPLDDSWIHQVVARNLANDGTLGFIPGVRSSGSSSLLWSFLLAAQRKFVPALNPVVYTYFLNWLALIATGTGLFAIARRDGLPETSCWIWAITPSLNGNFVWLGVVGMEHVLFVAFSVLAIFFWFERSRLSAVLAALCLGALCVTRPEGVVLIVLAVLGAGWARRGRGDIIIIVSTVSLFFAAGLAANFVTSNSWLPLTYVGRKWLYFGSETIPIHAHFRFLGAVLGRPAHAWSFLNGHTWSFFLVLPLIATIDVLLALGLWRLWQLRGVRCGFLCIWSFALIAIYAVILPVGGHASRYQPVFLLLTFPLMFLGSERIVRRLLELLKVPSTEVSMQRIIMLSVCLLCGGLSLRIWRRAAQDGMTVVESTHAKMGQFLVDTFHQQTRVAAFDIGRMGYIYGSRLSDLGGLTDSSFLPYLRQHRVLDYMETSGIQYFVWPTSTDGTVVGLDAFLKVTPAVGQRLVTVTKICAPTDTWSFAVAATGVAFQCQTLFRLGDANTVTKPPGAGAATVQ